MALASRFLCGGRYCVEVALQATQGGATDIMPVPTP